MLTFSEKNIQRCCKLTGDYWKFTAEVKHLDLEYCGEFETTIHYSSTPMTLLEQSTDAIEAILNQLEIDNCVHDYTANDILELILNELHIWNAVEAISEFGIFFTYSNGCEGQYYVQLVGNKIVE